MTDPTVQSPAATLPTLEDVRGDINQLLDEYYATNQARAALLHPSYARQWLALHQAHRAGGKRLRPYLLLLTYVGLGGKNYAAALPAAAAVELLHASLLVHDDIIDRDYVRHGAPNVSGQYLQTYGRRLTDPVQRRHYADSAALLAGDLLLAGAYQLLHTSHLPTGQKLAALELLSEAVFVVAGGELLDTEAAFMPQTPHTSLRIAELKTAHYSFVTTMQMGALLADASPVHQKTLAQSGIAIGIAFQLADDLLGVFGDERLTGKSVASDLIEGKRTYLVERGLQLADAAGRRRLLTALGQAAASDDDREAARAVLIESGAKAETEAMMVQKQTEALDLIDTLPWQEPARRALHALFNTVIWRKA